MTVSPWASPAVVLRRALQAVHHDGGAHGQLRRGLRLCLTQIAQGWPKSWAKFRPLIGIGGLVKSWANSRDAGL